MLMLFLLVASADVWFGFICRPSDRGQFNLPVVVVETLESQLEALQLAREEETAAHIVEAMNREFSALLNRRGIPSHDYELLLPPPGEVDAFWVQYKAGKRWTLSNFDDYLDELTDDP